MLFGCWCLWSMSRPGHVAQRYGDLSFFIHSLALPSASIQPPNVILYPPVFSLPLVMRNVAVFSNISHDSEHVPWYPRLHRHVNAFSSHIVISGVQRRHQWSDVQPKHVVCNRPTSVSTKGTRFLTGWTLLDLWWSALLKSCLSGRKTWVDQPSLKCFLCACSEWPRQQRSWTIKTGKVLSRKFAIFLSSGLNEIESRGPELASTSSVWEGIQS